MKTWVVQIEASFSDTVEVEAETYQDAMADAAAQFEDEYQVVNQYGLPWDNVEAVSAEEWED